MEAVLYQTEADNAIRCLLCRHHCFIKDGKRGICNVRENQSGVLHSLVYGRIVARHVDPIEKKPLFHVMPGSLSYSIATVGCNFRCRFCQNASIAQMPTDRNGMIAGEMIKPDEIVHEALKHRCRSISFTYTEPTVYFELALETAKLAKTKNLLNIFVTNGYMSSEALEMIAPYLDAANVDLKAFSDDFYRQYCGARLAEVQASLTEMKRRGILLEITTLLIPGLNDDEAELKQMADFIHTSLGAETPWHISRFHPTYRLTDLPPTPEKTLTKARNIGIRAGLKHVYTGNVRGNEGEHTYCPECGKIIIERWGFQVTGFRIKNSACEYCGCKINGISLSS